jgi:hypothetical protein
VQRPWYWHVHASFTGFVKLTTLVVQAVGAIANQIDIKKSMNK